MTISIARFSKTSKHSSKHSRKQSRKPLRHPVTASSSSSTISSSTTASSPTNSTSSSPTHASSSSPLTLLPSAVVRSSIRPSFSLQDALLKSSLPDYLINIRNYAESSTKSFCARICAILLVIFHFMFHRELHATTDDPDDFLQTFLMRPFQPLSTYVNARKSELGPSTMLSRFDDISTFTCWYCVHDIARCIACIHSLHQLIVNQLLYCVVQVRALYFHQGLHQRNAAQFS